MPSAQMVALNKQKKNLENKAQVHARAAKTLSCDFCRIDHQWEECPLKIEIANFIGKYNKNQNNNYSNTYNPRWRNHPNFRWGENQIGSQKPRAKTQAPLGFQAQAQNQMKQLAKKKMSMEDMFMRFMQTQQQEMQTLQASIRNQENQLVQLACALDNRPLGRLPSDTQVLRMEEGKECKAIELGSRKELSNPHNNQKPYTSDKE